MPFAPAPSAVRAGDYVFTSSIYPIDKAGHAIETDILLGEAGPSLIAAQTRHCLEALKAILKEHGSSLDRVLKAEVHLVDAADFYEFKLVWREYFPKEPPARTTVEVGDTLPFRGARLNLDVVALAGDSKLERQVLRDPEGPDPIEAEAAPWAVRAGNLVFCSGFTASNFSTGLAAGRRPGFPNYGNDAVAQAEYFFNTLNRVLAQAGTSLEQALESYLYEPDLGTFFNIDSTWTHYMPVPPGRASMGIKGLMVPGACFVASLTVLVPDKDHVKERIAQGHQVSPRQCPAGQLHPHAHGRPVDLHSGQNRGRYADGARRAGGIAPPLLRYRGANAPHHGLSDRTDQSQRLRLGPLPPRAHLADKSATGLSRLQSGVARVFPGQQQGTGARLCPRHRDHVSGAVDRDRSDLRRSPVGAGRRENH